MTQEEKYKITSNDFADIFVQYNENEAILQRYTDYTVHIINGRLAVVYYPAAEIAQKSIAEIGYSSIPKCYGLESERSLDASSVLRIRETPAFGLRGQGVLVGIVDTGIDYTNPVFIRSDGTSKIISIWDQTIDREDQYPLDTFYGTEYTQEQINRALSSSEPFEVVPSKDDIGHGTMLAGIAAGAEMNNQNFSGVVPDSDLVIVKLKQAKPILRDFFAIPEDVPCYQENDIIWGVQYLIAIARRQRRPMALCIGLGTSQGSHDGRGTLSTALSIDADFPGISIVVSAGNEGNMRRHYFGSIDSAIGYQTVELHVNENERDFSMELWGAAPSTYSIDITTPSGENVTRIRESLRYSRNINFIFEETQLKVDYILVERIAGDQLILLRFINPAAGIWTFRVYSMGDLPGSFHIWLPMNSFVSEETYFVQSNPYTTITAPGNSLVPITVTAYNPENSILYQNASRGYTRIHEIKPELAAPGVSILSPTLDHGFEAVSGTGAAAAHATGVTAMMLEWGVVRGFYPGMDTIEVKKFLIRGARRSTRLQYPNRDWGYGAIDIYNTFSVLRSVF